MTVSNQITGSDFVCTLNDGRSEFFTFEHRGGFSLGLSGLTCGNFSEEGALLDRCRTHETIDRLSCTAEMDRTIPFGSEYQVRRQWTISDGFCRITTDVDPGAGTVEMLKLEPVVLRGDWVRATLFTIDGQRIAKQVLDLNQDGAILYESESPLLAFQLADGQGNELEVGCGNDLWRHSLRTAIGEHCRSLFTLSGGKGEIRYERKVLEFDKEFALKRRSWRFKYYFAWSLAGREVEGDFSVLTPDWAPFMGTVRNLDDAPCISAPAARRLLRELVRKSATSLQMALPIPGLCMDAGHLERPGREELLHWDIEDYMELYLWGNRTLNKRDCRLILDAPGDFTVLKSIRKTLRAELTTSL